VTLIKVFRADEDEVQREHEAWLQRVEDRRQLRLKLLRHGYEPIPTIGKEIYIRGWQRGEITEARIIQETNFHLDHSNTGLRTGRLVPVDIDLHDDDEVSLIRELTSIVWGPTPFRRRGSKGEMLCYRLADGETPIGKIKLTDKSIIDATGKRKGKTLVEIFGQGGQFIAYGQHPTAGRDYEWLEPGQEPLLVPFRDIPAVTVGQIRQLYEHLKTVLTQMGYQVESDEEVRGTYSTPGTSADSADITEKFLRLVPHSARLSATGFRNFSCPACGRNDRKSGLLVLPNGGFRFRCFHLSCEYSRATGWQPGGALGERTIKLYELMGGDREEIRPKRWMPQGFNWQEMLAEMQAELDARNTGPTSVVREDNSAWDAYLDAYSEGK
jgi:hypothetical protein